MKMRFIPKKDAAVIMDLHEFIKNFGAKEMDFWYQIRGKTALNKTPGKEQNNRR